MTTWYFCVSPDYPADDGQFLSPDPPANSQQFWYNADTGAVYGGPDTPPALFGGAGTKDKVGFAVEVTQNSGSDDYSVNDITAVSTVCQNPVGGTAPASIGSAFRRGQHIVSHYSGAPLRTALNIGGRKYSKTGLHTVKGDGGGGVSAYEIVLVATISDAIASYDYSTDPEMDVSN
jgi:hypothetical protein